MCHDVERERRHVARLRGHQRLLRGRRYDERLVCEVFELGVASVDSKDDGTATSSISDTFEQWRARIVGCDDDDGFAAFSVLQPRQVDCKVCWRVCRR